MNMKIEGTNPNVDQTNLTNYVVKELRYGGPGNLIPEQKEIIAATEQMFAQADSFVNACKLPYDVRNIFLCDIRVYCVQACRDARKRWEEQREKEEREKKEADAKTVDALVQRITTFLHCNPIHQKMVESGCVEDLVFDIRITELKSRFNQHHTISMKHLPPWNRMIILAMYHGMNLKTEDGTVDHLLERAFLLWNSYGPVINNGHESADCFLNEKQNVGSLRNLRNWGRYFSEANVFIERIIQ
jgi:hypothetical protein